MGMNQPSKAWGPKFSLVVSAKECAKILGERWTISQNFTSPALTVWERQCLEDLCKILRCFIKKVSNDAIPRFSVAFFFAHVGTLCYFLAFFELFGSLGPFTLLFLQIRFVVIYALFLEKYFWLKPCLCKFFLSVYVQKDFKVLGGKSWMT